MAASYEEIISSLQQNYYNNTGIQTIIGSKVENEAAVVSALGDTVSDSSFRIGSQTKMFTSTVILKMIDDGYSFSLDTKLGDITADSTEGQAKLDRLLDLLPSEVADNTIRDFLNMGTELPNFMSGTPEGSDKTIWDLWIEAQYGAVPGYSEDDPEAHERLIALSTPLFPGEAPEGFEYFYSNTNPLVLAYMAEALSGKNFDELLEAYVLNALGLKETGLQMETGDVDTIGTEAGVAVTDMDPTIPWSSGSGYASMASLLSFLEVVNKNINGYLSQELFEARTDPENQHTITMNGMLISYGLGVMSLDWQEMLGSFGLGDFAIDVSSTGHGGSIAGSSSFSGWLTSNSVDLDLGLAVYANSLTTMANGGFFTATPSEALFVSTVNHLYRVAKADGTLEDNVFSYGATGGYVTQEQYSGREDYAFTNPNAPSLIASIDLTTDPELPLVLQYDPTYTYYSAFTSASPTSGDESAFLIKSGGSVDLPTYVRIEGYGGTSQDPDASFVMIDMEAGSSAILDGEVAAYGKNAIALRTEQDVVLGELSHLYSKGVGGVALHVYNGAVVDVHSQSTSWLQERSGILAEGSQSAGLRVESLAEVNIYDGATVTAVTYGYSMANDFTTVDPWLNAVYGAEVSSEATLNVMGGAVSGVASNPWDGSETATGTYIADSLLMPGIIAAGIKTTGGTVAISENSLVSGTAYGLVADGVHGETQQISITDSYVSGGLYSLKAVNNADLHLNAQDAVFVGGIQMAEAASTSTLTMKDSLLSTPGYDGSAMASFGGSLDIDAGNTFLLPTTFDTIYVRDTEAGDVITFTPTLKSYADAFIVSISPDYATATLSGFTHGNANARRMFPAFAEYGEANLANLGEDGVANLALQADRLTPEPYATQALISLSLHSALVDSAKALAFPASGRRQTYGMTSISDQAHAMSPELAFGEGRAISAFHQDIRENIVAAQSRTLSEHGPIRKNDRSFLSVSARSPLVTRLGQEQSAPMPRSGLFGNQQALLDQQSLNAFGSGGGSNWRVFGGYFYQDQDQNSRKGYYGYDATTNGMIFGLAASLTSKLDVAFYGSWSTTDTDYKSIGAEVDTDSAHFGLLGRYVQPLDETLDLRLSANLGYSRMENDMERKIRGTTTIERAIPGATLKGSFDQDIYSAGVEAILDIYPAALEGFRVSPFVSATYLHLEQDGATERGLAALKVHSGDMDQFSTVLGLGLAQDFTLSDAWLLTASLAASWKHDFRDVDYNLNANYVGYTTDFSAHSLERGRDALLLGVGLDALWELGDNKMLGAKIGYGTEFRDASLNQQVFAGLEFRF